nr:uncharacterized protein LOC109167340 [Ipomoea batatas]GMD93430.1 uncharacterized protein LOC109167340 [Ipomoea batatas]
MIPVTSDLRPPTPSEQPTGGVRRSATTAVNVLFFSLLASTAAMACVDLRGWPSPTSSISPPIGHRCSHEASWSQTTGSHRKRTRNLDIVPFEGREGPSDVAVEGKQPKSKKQCASRHGLPIVKSRASSPHYVEAIQKFNTAQRKAVEEMRFGRFLELQIKLFLTELSYALLNSYNPMNSKFSLKDGLMVNIIEDDVAVILNFPWGIVEIERKKKKKGMSFPLRTEFKEKF